MFSAQLPNAIQCLLCLFFIQHVIARMILSDNVSRQHIPPISPLRMGGGYTQSKPQYNISVSPVCNISTQTPPLRHALIQTFRKPPPSNLESRHPDTFPRAQSGKVFLLHRHSLSSWTSLLLSIMIASITSCGVVSPLQADFPLSRPSQTCTGGLQRNMIAHEWIYPLIP